MVFDIIQTFLQSMELGPYTNYIIATGIIIGSVILSKVFLIIFEKVFLHVTSKTKTTLDDKIMDAIRKPIYTAIVLLGIFLSIDFLNVLDAYLMEIQIGFTVIWILLGIYTATKVIKALFSWYAEEIAIKTKSKSDETLMPMLRKIINVFVLLIGLMIILRSFGIEITGIIAGLGIAGLAIALALQEPLSNLFAGAFVISDKVLHVGDYVDLPSENIQGYVVEIGWRSSKIRTFTNNLIIIPNTKLANSIMINYETPVSKTGFIVDVGVGYDSDLENVEKITLEVANEVLEKTKLGASESKPVVRFKEFGDSNINFIVYFEAKTRSDQFVIKHEFIKELKKRYDKEGIDISYPVRKIIQKK